MILERSYDGNWNRWFSWYPVRLPDEWDGKAVVVRYAWLHWVERRRAYYNLLGERVTSYRMPNRHASEIGPESNAAAARGRGHSVASGACEAEEPSWLAQASGRAKATSPL